MANAKRPNKPADASKIPGTNVPNPQYQVHNNMAPFSPAPVENDTAGGSRDVTTLHEKMTGTLEEGTGRW